MTMRRGGSISTISPVSVRVPSGLAIFQGEPCFQSHSMFVPNQYWRMNCGWVSASHSLAGVARMKVT